MVSRIGRKRNMHASTMESYEFLPSFREAARAKSIIMMAFFFTMPISRIVPMIAIILRSKPEASAGGNVRSSRVEYSLQGPLNRCGCDRTCYQLLILLRLFCRRPWAIEHMVPVTKRSDGLLLQLEG